MPRRLRALGPLAPLPILVSAVVAAGVLLSAATTGLALTSPWPPAWKILLAFTLSGASWLMPLQLRPKAGGFVYAWGETAMILSLGLLPAIWVVPLALLATLGAQLSQRRSFVKAAYNAATQAICGTAAGLALIWIATGRQHSFWWLGLAVAGVIASLVGSFLASLVVSVASGRALTNVLRDEWRLQVLMTLGNTASGLAILALVRWRVEVLLLLPVILWGIRRAYAQTQTLASQQRAFRELEAATAKLSHLDEEDVLFAVVTGAAELFTVESVEVRLRHPSGERPYYGGKDGLHETAAAKSVASASAQLTAADQALGELLLHFPSRVTLSAQESQALSTFAAAAASALLNARLHAKAVHDATHDSLTGLPNRRELLSRVDAFMAQRGEKDRAAFLLVDLDRFKEVNDTLGHGAGDVILEEVSRRIAAVVGDGHLVARLGGDEFAILLPTIASETEAAGVAEGIVESLTRPAEVDGITVGVGGSVGVACVPRDATNRSELLRCADVAMYEAKAAGGGRAKRYDMDRDGRSVERLSLEPGLRTALERDDQLLLYFQPEFDLPTGRPSAAEALIRWRHPVYGLLTPDVFLPVVEKCGLSDELTRYVLRAALRHRAGWHQRSGVDVPVAVNLFSRNLLDPSFPRKVDELITAAGTPPERVILEIPESIVSTELDVVIEVLAGLKALGVQLSMDDFGSGSTPLTLLTRVPVTELKIDRSFVEPMNRTDNAMAVVRATIELAHALDLRVVAEGVQTTDQRDALRALGCDVAQGFLYDPPLHADEIAFALSADGRTRTDAPVVPIRAARRR